MDFDRIVAFVNFVSPVTPYSLVLESSTAAGVLPLPSPEG